nr:MAG: nonstructural protein [Microvirus sp.]
MSQIQKLYSVFDQKAETYMAPFCVPTTGLAIRAFEDCVNSKTHHFGQHPHDYTLFQVASFDTDTGEMIFEGKKSIGNGVEFLAPTKSDTGDLFNEPPTDPPVQPD